MRSQQQRIRAHKQQIELARKQAILEQQLTAKEYAAAREAYEAGNYGSASWLQKCAAVQYYHVQGSRNRLQRLIDGTLIWSYSEMRT